MGEFFWQKDSLITHILSELRLITRTILVRNLLTHTLLNTISLDLPQILKTKKVNKSIKEEMVSAPCYCVSNFRKLQHTKVLFTGFQRTKYLPTLTYACRNEGSSKKRNFNSIWQHEFSSALICNVQNDFMVEKSHFMTHT